MTKRVILLNCERSAPAVRELTEALRAAGIEVLFAQDQASSAEPLSAIIHGVIAGDRMNALNRNVQWAKARWPSVPIIACRLHSPDESQTARRLSHAALKRIGFHLVADEAAQLPALLHEIEGRDIVAEIAAEEEAERRPLPEIEIPADLASEPLRAAFALVAALHFTEDQRRAVEITLRKLAPLIGAERLTFYLAQDEGIATSLEPFLTYIQSRSSPNATSMASVSAFAQSAVSQVKLMSALDEGRALLAAPLVYEDKVLGVIEAERSNAFSPADEMLVTALAPPIAAAIFRAIRLAEAERLSQTDDLTKLHNARFLRQHLISEIKRARRYGSPVSALFLDLDDFKCVNDEHGHLVGSHVLMEMAAVILSSVRDTDIVARYGGDEFVIILPETDAKHAAHVAERVRARIANHRFTGGRGLRLQLTASFGVAAFPEHAQSPQQLLARADAAMYEAKAARKDCVRIAATAASNAHSENHSG